MHPDFRAGDNPEKQLRQASVELSQRLRAGEDCRAEHFFSSFPALASHEGCALELICTEFLVRQELGQPLDPSEWYARFPHWRDRLRGLLQPPGLSESAALDPTTVPVTPRATAPGHAGGVVRPGRAFAHYELFEELGHGGMGVVYRAEDTVLGRTVALKMIRSGVLAQEEEVRRFYREARAAAQLHHPHIVPIHEIGQYQGQHYFTMPFVGGGSLARQRQRFQADPHAAVALVEKIARAVHAAHQRGILHRDLKPGNVLLDEQGQPLVGDFGLAKFLDADAEITQSGQIVGTPAYMAPEQAAGQVKAVSARSDVWALGVILYELLTGQRPFAGQGFTEVSQRILTADPPRPRSLRPELDRAMETVVLKCLQKEPDRRYPSAEALADDLGRWLRGEPVLARPEGWPRRAWRALHRHRARAALTLGGLAVLAALTALIVRPERGRRTESPEPDVPLKALQRRLAAGKTVVLIGANGPPRWFHWSTAPAAIKGTSARDGAFTFHTLSLNLLELVPDPRTERFRFSAEVRLNESVHGRAGLYYAYSKHATDQGIHHHLCDLTFDRTNAGSELALKLRAYTETDLKKNPNDTASPWRKVYPLPARRPHEASWHRLAVKVTPARTTVFWDGRPAGELAQTVLKTYARALLDDLPAQNRPRAAFNPRGGLGLFVYRGSASFRRVVLQPLSPNQ